MKRIDIRRMVGAAGVTGALSLAACAGATQPQGDHAGGMMGGDGWMGGYGGPWMLILLIVIVGLVVWFIARGRRMR